MSKVIIEQSGFCVANMKVPRRLRREASHNARCSVGQVHLPDFGSLFGLGSRFGRHSDTQVCDQRLLGLRNQGKEVPGYLLLPLSHFTEQSIVLETFRNFQQSLARGLSSLVDKYDKYAKHQMAKHVTELPSSSADFPVHWTFSRVDINRKTWTMEVSRGLSMASRTLCKSTTASFLSNFTGLPRAGYRSFSSVPVLFAPRQLSPGAAKERAAAKEKSKRKKKKYQFYRQYDKKDLESFTLCEAIRLAIP